jgi:hypothetical protein
MGELLLLKLAGIAAADLFVRLRCAPSRRDPHLHALLALLAPVPAARLSYSRAIVPFR